MTLHIKNGKSLSKYLEMIMEDSMRQAMYEKSLDEKELQDALSEADDDEDEDIDLGDEDEDEGDAPSKTMDDDYESLKKGEITADDIIEKLNSIRSGRSFKDDDVSNNMEEYVDSLNKAERTALLAFLKGISQIVTGEIPAPKATEPSKTPSSVKMEKETSGPSKFTVKPTIIKVPPKEEKKKPPAEDTSGPVPIKPKKGK
jgi:hypothetical protein